MTGQVLASQLRHDRKGKYEGIFIRLVVDVSVLCCSVSEDQPRGGTCQDAGERPR